MIYYPYLMQLLEKVVRLKLNIYLNENGYLGLRGLFRLRLDGTVEENFPD